MDRRTNASDDSYDDRQFERRMAVSREARAWSAEARAWFLAFSASGAAGAAVALLAKAGVLS